MWWCCCWGLCWRRSWRWWRWCCGSADSGSVVVACRLGVGDGGGGWESRAREGRLEAGGGGDAWRYRLASSDGGNGGVDE